MRLINMYYLIKDNYFAILDLDFKIMSGNISDSEDSLLLWLNAQQALRNLKKIGCFNDIINETTNLINKKVNDSNSSGFSALDFETIQSNITSLSDYMDGVIRFCEELDIHNFRPGFDVKFPVTKNFSELTDYVNTLNNVFTQCPYLNIKDQQFELESFDIGGTWMKFSVGAESEPIFRNLIVILNRCTKIKLHMLTCKQQEEQYNILSMQNDMIESVKKANVEATKALIQQSSDDLQKYLPPLTPEEIKNLKITLTDLSNLLAKGMEFYPSKGMVN